MPEPRHLHRIVLDTPGTLAGARAVCLAPDTAECRQWCTEGCEDGCWETPLLTGADGQPAELVAQAPIAGHRWAPYGGCRGADWINAAGVEDSHTDDGFPFEDDRPDQLRPRSGPVTISWTGDDYVWEYAPTDEPEPAVPGPGQLALAEAPA